MGAGMAANYLKHNYPVTLWNRSKDKLVPFKKRGAGIAATPREAAESADIVFEVTADDASSRKVWLGRDGILAGAKKNAVLISSGTFSIPWIDELARACRVKGFSYFDIPLTGSRPGAEKGELILLVGGDERGLKKLQPDLRPISSQIFYFGKPGSGARYKLLLNMLYAIHLLGFAEALKMANRGGLNLARVAHALIERPGGSTTKFAWERFLAQPKPIHFSMQWMAKDLRYAKKLAGPLDTPLLNAALKKLSLAVKKGKGEQDWTSIVKA